MDEDALENVFSYVERAYVRMQAGDVITQCLDEGRLTPLQSLVEMLIVVGPQSLDALREILSEVSARKSQIKNDQHQVFIKLENELKDYGVQLGGAHSLMSLARLTPAVFLAFLRSQKVEDESDQYFCLQRLEEALDLMRLLVRHLDMLDEIEIYLQDWLWGLMYESAQEDWGEAPKPFSKNLPLQ
jgi:hypothetical protein